MYKHMFETNALKKLRQLDDEEEDSDKDTSDDKGGKDGKYIHYRADVEIFLDIPVIRIDCENLFSPNNKICSRNIKF